MAIDVDGTLVGTNNLVRDDVWEALAGARQAGMRLAVCSGRPAVGNALAYAQRLDPTGWHVFQNGASVVKVDTGESLSQALPTEQLSRLLSLARERGWLLELYTDTDMAVTQAGDLAQRHAALLGIPYDPKAPHDLQGTVVRAQWVVPHHLTTEVLNLDHTGLDLHPAGSPVMPDVTFISVTRAGVNKGQAVTEVACHYGVPLDRVMAVGDGENDLYALRVVGHPVAMGNAEAAVKAAARTLVGHVDEGGLREAVALALAW